MLTRGGHNWRFDCSQYCGACLCRVGHFILRALAIWASNPQNALAQISFHWPESLTLHYPLPHLDHAVAMASQVAISPKTSSSCSSCSPLNHSFGFFLFFSSPTTFGTPKNYFHILARNHSIIFNLPEKHALIKNNLLATSSSTW